MNLVELLLVVLAISFFSVHDIAQIDKNPFSMDQFKSELLHAQWMALTFQETLAIDDQWGIDLRFNFNGNVNQPFRVDLNHRELTVMLGTGRFHE